MVEPGGATVGRHVPGIDVTCSEPRLQDLGPSRVLCPARYPKPGPDVAQRECPVAICEPKGHCWLLFLITDHYLVHSESAPGTVLRAGCGPPQPWEVDALVTPRKPRQGGVKSLAGQPASTHCPGMSLSVLIQRWQQQRKAVCSTGWHQGAGPLAARARGGWISCRPPILTLSCSRVTTFLCGFKDAGRSLLRSVCCGVT